MGTTFPEDKTTVNHVDNPRPSQEEHATPQSLPVTDIYGKSSQTSAAQAPDPQNAVYTAPAPAPAHFRRPPTLLQFGPDLYKSPDLYAPSPYPQHGYSSTMLSMHKVPPVLNSMKSTVFQPPEMHQPGMATTDPADVDTTGQIAPPGAEPRVMATRWEEEGTLSFQVEARGICVARRENNNMINGTMLLNVAGVTGARRDGILLSEKVRHIVETGPEHLKGVWIPFERALDFANKEKITGMLYPLFVQEIGALLSHPINRVDIVAVAGRRKAEGGIQMRHAYVRPTSSTSGPGRRMIYTPGASPEPEANNIMNADPKPRDTEATKAGLTPEVPAVSNVHEPSLPSPISLLPREHVWDSEAIAEAEVLDPGREGSTSPRSSVAKWKPKDEEDNTSSDEKKHFNPKFNNTFQYGTTRMSNNDDVPEALPQIIVVGDQSPGKSSVLESLSKVPFPKDPQLRIELANNVPSQHTIGNKYVEVGESQVAHTQAGSLSPSQKSPQSESEHSSDSEAGLLTRNERRSILLDRLMAYFFELLSSCPSPVPVTSTDSPMMPDGRNGRQITEDDRAPPPLPPPRFQDQSMDRQAPLSVPYPQSVVENDQYEASLFSIHDYHQYKNQDNGPVQDGLDSGAGQSNVSASTAASGNRQDHALHQSAGPIQKRDREKEDDDKDERQPGKRARIDNDKNNAPKRLACPYFKNDPEHPRLGRSCSGPGWGTAHRLKEHLDRNHALPPSCVRCYTAFDTEADRDTHMRIQDQCQVRERPGRMHGFDAAQKEQLRSRPKGYKHMSETQKWCHIYMILFPETASTEVPSPYYEFVSFRDSGHPVDPMIEYENFLRQEMPGRVRHQLELRIDEILDLSEETLRGQMIDFVRDIQLELFQTFRASRGPARPNGDSVQESASIEIDDNPDKSQDEEREGTDAQNSTWVARNTEPPGQFDSGQCSWEEQLEAYRQVPPLDFSFTDFDDFDDFDGALFDFSSVIPAAQDSAYGTLSISHGETDKDEFIGNGTGI